MSGQLRVNVVCIVDSVWWTPSGQVSASQPQDDLLITDITERDTGLYVCVSEEHEVGSVFNLQISKIEGNRRKPRSLPQGTPNRIGQERNQRAARCNLALAVCLSVFITFLIAFIIGVLARPYIDILWRRVTKKKRSTETNSASDVEQRQYDNEAYSNGEEPEVPSSRRERRVTFSDVDIRENTDVQYYDTVASGDQESLYDDAVFEREAAKAERDRHTAEDSGSESSSRQSSPEKNRRDLSNAGRKHNIEFEHIPDPDELEKRRSSSSSSDSSLSGKEDRITQRDLTRPKSPQLAKGSVQQRADFLPGRTVELPQISTEGSENLEFSSEPFADWSPHTKNPNLTDSDLWQENDEQFEFSDSVRSSSPRSSSVHGSFNDSKLIVAPTPNKQKRDDTSSSSSSSYVSEGEPTEYTVNLDPVNEKDTESNHNKPEVTIMPSLGFNQGDYRYDPQRPTGRPKGSFSSHSSDSDGENHTGKKEKDTREADTQKKVVPMPRTKFREPSSGVINHGKKTRAPPPPVAPSSSSSSESEAEIKDLKVDEGIKISEPKIQSTKLDPQIKRSLDIKARLPVSDSSSSSDSEAETTGHRKKQEQGQTNMARPPIKVPQPASHDPQTQWPVLDLEHTTGIKRRLDIKLPSLATESSSSSDSEDEKTGHIKKQEQGQTNVEKLPIKVSSVRAPRPDSESSSSSDSEAEKTGQKQKQMLGKVDSGDPPFRVSQTVNLDLQTQWPVLDLGNTAHIKRRLDIKAPSPDSESSSSSSDIENEKNGHIKKQEQGQTNVGRLPITAWQPKIKAQKPGSESSSSSDSEAERAGHIKKQEQGQTNMAGLPIKVSPSASNDPQTQWPVLDLGHTTRIKRRLDFKVPSPASESSSSSSDSEDEKTGHIKKREQGQTNMVKLPIKASQHSIKEPKPDSDSSSSSDSEAETTGHTKKQEQGQTNMARLPIKVSQTASHDPKTQWPVLDLEHTTRIKRRLDIRVPSQASKSSSSSDSEDEKTGHIKKQGQGQPNIVKLPIKVSQTNVKAPRPDSESSSSSDSEAEKTGQKKKQILGKVDSGDPPFQVSQTVNPDLQTQWPVLDLQHTTHIKRRLDIKAPSPDSESSSSSSDSENENTGHIKKQEQGQTNTVKLPIKVPQRSIKAPRPDSESSSSSDSEAETTGQIKKQEQGQTNTARLPVKESQTASTDLQTQWPVLDLEHTTRIKRRLDIKAPSPESESSSSSDSEDEKSGHIRKQEQGQANITKLPIKVSQTNVKASRPDSESSSSSDSEAETTGQWPVLDLGHTTRIKRRLDFKAPSPTLITGHLKRQEQGQTNVGRPPITEWQPKIKAQNPGSESSSSSDSEDETTGHRKKQEQGQINMAGLPIKASPTASNNPQTRWSLLDLEHTTSIKRRLDIKAPSPASESSSSSSDSEAEKTGHMKKQEQKQTNMAGLPIKISQTNVKAPTPDSESSSSSDSEAEQTGRTKKPEQWQTNMAQPPIKVSQTTVKAPRRDLESSTSSDSEAETTGQIKKQEQGQTNTSSLFTKVSHTASNEPQTRWPLLDLEHKTSIKRRLDIKAPSPASKSSSSSESEDETTQHTHKKERPELLVIAGLPFTVSKTVSRDPEKQWPAVDLGNTTRIKRRLDIKAPSPAPQALVSSGREGKREEANKVSSSSSSSSSDEQEEDIQGFIKSPQTTEPMPHPDSRWPPLGLSSAPPPDSSSSSESEGKITDLPIKVERDRTTVGITKNPHQTNLDMSIPLVKRRIDIKAPSPQPDPIQSRVSLGSQQSNSSTSDSEDENHSRLGLGSSTISKATEKKFNWSPKIPGLHTSLSPQTDHDIKLSKYTVITDGVGDRTSDNINTAPVVTPELESRWATMNLGISRFRKRLEITSNEPPNLPSSPPPDSPTSRTRRKRWGVGIGGITHTQSSTTLEKASPSLTGQDDNSVESKERSSKAYSLPKTEDSSSSSDSENESKGGRGRSQLNDTIDHSWPDLSLGVQHTNRNLNIKARSSESSSSSSSSSENEHEGTGHSAKQSRHPSDMLGVTENSSLITYKRQIFSSPTPDHTNQRQTGAEILSVAQGGPLLSVGIRDESLAPRRVPSMNFDDVVKKRIEQSRHTTDVDLPPEIRWTGIGRQPSDLSISSMRRTLDINSSTSSAQPELSLLDSFNYSSLSTKSIHLASSTAIDKSDNLPDSLNNVSRAVPEDRRQSKGLSALKAMSSERRKWDTQAENLDKGASSLFDDPQFDNSFYNRRPEKDIKPPEKRATDLWYDIPHYRRHDIGGIDQMQEMPPPLPATPPPDEAVELKWGSPQSSMKQGFAGTRSYLQLNRNRVELDPSSNTSQSLTGYFDPINTNISHV